MKIIELIKNFNWPNEIFGSDKSLSNFTVAMVLAFFLVLLHGVTLGYGFNGEDFILTIPLSDYSFLEQGKLATEMYFRPLWHLWFAIQYELFGFNDFAFHASQLSFHFILMYLGYSLFVKIGFKQYISIFAVCLWTLLSSAAFPIVWPNQNSDMICLFFVLCSYHVAWSYFKGGEKDTKIFFFALCLWFLSLFGKEMGFAAPLLFILISYVRSLKEAGKIKFFNKTVLLSVLGLASFVATKFLYHGGAGGFSSNQYSKSQTADSSIIVKLVGKAVHFVEGIFYSAFPLDLANNVMQIIFVLLVSVISLVAFYFLIKRMSTNARIVLAALAVVSISLGPHTMFNPHPRTLYVPSIFWALTYTVIIAPFLYGIFVEKKILSTMTEKFVLLTICLFFSVQVMLVKNVQGFFAPRSDNMIQFYSHMLHQLDQKERSLEQEKIDYALKEMEHVKVLEPTEGLRNYYSDEIGRRYGELSYWRTFAKSMFKKVFQRHE
ncbi:hypothetical protein HBN50_05440 [Halobacteriovorax sp. GB3]|uniref:hypothetical protein n=1 Tax=Halobacteriovorax sp. GB3 TaxID=2719615 RepID=UPI00235F4D76|nr:hypothetical protein [Halobacteriovorax sp. GB3]MDD0852530.1 hypothetical protein [Halobacteriovorax sp. GB3]